MIFEQTYSIKIKVRGRSTMQMQIFEEMLGSLAKVFDDKNNVEVTLQDGKGNSIDKDTFSFLPYANGFPINLKKNH